MLDLVEAVRDCGLPVEQAVVKHVLPKLAEQEWDMDQGELVAGARPLTLPVWMQAGSTCCCSPGCRSSLVRGRT
jgi:hypothetical protein